MVAANENRRPARRMNDTRWFLPATLQSPRLSPRLQPAGIRSNPFPSNP
jgi:hypothetical protein